MKREVLFSGLISLVLLLAVGFMGCLEDPTDEDTASVQITNFTSMVPGTKQLVDGTIETSLAIDNTGISVSITKGGVDVTANFVIEKTSFTAKDKIDLQDDYHLGITPNAGIASGTDYRLTITATAGSASGSDNVDFSITGTTPDLVVHDVTIGSWDNSTYGSSLEADTFGVYKVAVAATLCADVDVWYSNEAIKGLGPNVFYSPKQAGIAQHPPKNWTTQNETKMAVVSVNFDAITKQTQVDSIWAAVPAGDKAQLLRLNANDIVILETNQGNKRLIKFVSGDGSNTGVCQIKGKE